MAEPSFWDRGKSLYRAGRSCPKCGYHIVESKHATFGRLGMPDYIRRTCQRCERTWDEIPLDRAPTTEAAEPLTPA